MNKRWSVFVGGHDSKQSNIQPDDNEQVEQAEAGQEEDDWFNAESQFHKKKEEVLVTEQDATTHTIRVSRIPTAEFQQRLARASLK